MVSNDQLHGHKAAVWPGPSARTLCGRVANGCTLIVAAGHEAYKGPSRPPGVVGRGRRFVQTCALRMRLPRAAPHQAATAKTWATRAKCPPLECPAAGGSWRRPHDQPLPDVAASTAAATSPSPLPRLARYHAACSPGCQWPATIDCEIPAAALSSAHSFDAPLPVQTCCKTTPAVSRQRPAICCRGLAAKRSGLPQRKSEIRHPAAKGRRPAARLHSPSLHKALPPTALVWWPGCCAINAK